MGKGYRNIPQATKDFYLDWLMAPPAERDPATKEEVAHQLGVATSTLYSWEATPAFQDEMRLLKHKWGLRFHGDILGRLMQIVQQGTDTAAIAAAKVLLPHLDTGPREVKESDIDAEGLKRLKEGLKAIGYEVIEE